jgi:hypothetical protein
MYQLEWIDRTVVVITEKSVRTSEFEIHAAKVTIKDEAPKTPWKEFVRKWSQDPRSPYCCLCFFFAAITVPRGCCLEAEADVIGFGKESLGPSLRHIPFFLLLLWCGICVGFCMGSCFEEREGNESSGKDTDFDD